MHDTMIYVEQAKYYISRASCKDCPQYPLFPYLSYSSESTESTALYLLRPGFFSTESDYNTNLSIELVLPL